MKQNTISVTTKVLAKTKDAQKVLNDNKVEGNALIILSAKGDAYKSQVASFLIG